MAIVTNYHNFISMKNIFILPLILVLTACLAFNGAAQTSFDESSKISTEKTKELVLGIPKLSEKLLPDLVNIIETTKGLSYVKYCEEHRLVLVRYEGSLYPRKEAIVKAIKDREFYPEIFIKETSFEGVEELCGQEYNN